jgi:Arc/MetJ-type ribon-helix-helix transcriptional regulator
MINSLPPDIQQRIEAQVASGLFATEEDVLRAALDGLERRQSSLKKLREILEWADEDVAAGRIGKFDREDMKRVVRGRTKEVDWGPPTGKEVW